MPNTLEADPRPDNLIPDPIIAKEFSVTLMTLWRWSHDPNLGFPQAIKIRGKNFRSRRAIEQFKGRMLMGAIRERVRVEEPA
ncbi:hypothetical protein ABIF66_002946 [Bradyrhizobium japonicum]